jgi:hypothetical protein
VVAHWQQKMVLEKPEVKYKDLFLALHFSLDFRLLRLHFQPPQNSGPRNAAGYVQTHSG